MSFAGRGCTGNATLGPQAASSLSKNKVHVFREAFCRSSFIFQFPLGVFLERINFEILQISKSAFRRKMWLSLLLLPVWFRCRQRGQPFGLPSVAFPESTPRCSRCLYALWATGTATGRPSGRSSRRASPCSALEQFQSEIALTGALHSLLVVFGSVGLSRSRAFVL